MVRQLHTGEFPPAPPTKHVSSRERARALSLSLSPPADVSDSSCLTSKQGHEGCGEVVAVGTATTQNFQVGDMVCVLFNPGCGDRLSCPECSYGVPQLCIRSTAYGIGSNGSFAPYVAIRERAAARLPQGISAAVGAVATDAVLTSYQAVVRRAKVQKGQTVVLFGLGGLGFNALQIILDIGARVVVVDRRQEVLDEAVKFGVPSDDVVPVGTTNVTEWIAQKGLLVDTVMDFVGMGETFKSALECGE